jgi:hypothetical protein
MKPLLAAAAAAMVLTGLSFGSASAEPYRHPEPGMRVIIGGNGVRMDSHGPRHHPRQKRCWTEKERFRDHHGRVHVRSVRVCR